jgi:hypothetical protein
MKTGYVYALVDPRQPKDYASRIRYIGVTLRTPGVRFAKHIDEARYSRRDYHRLRWIRSVLRDGLVPEVEVLERVTEDRLFDRERAWIAAHRAIGCDLTNSTDGGEGIVNPSPEMRRKGSLAKMGNRSRTGMRHSAEAKRKIGIGNSGERCGSAKLTWDQVRQIRAIGKSKRQYEIARMFGITASVVSVILSGKIWVERGADQ